MTSSLPCYFPQGLHGQLGRGFGSGPFHEVEGMKVPLHAITDIRAYRMGINWQVAMAMWNKGKDTLDKAKHFHCHESTIYNFLPRSKRQEAGK